MPPNGRLETPLASGELANILSIGELARDPVLVRPGLPDASRLYDVLETRHSPLDVFSGSAGGSEPGPDDIESVRGWIRDLKPAAQACALRQSVRPADVDKMVRDAQHLERDQGQDVRFISLVHLYNACATPQEMAGYAQALNKLMNSLSGAAEPVKLASLDTAGTVLSFRLEQFGWDAKHWNLIERAYPPALVHAVAADIAHVAGTKVAIVNGDWLAAATAETPLYYDLLGIPGTLAELAKMNATDIDQNIKSSVARRIALKTSCRDARQPSDRTPSRRPWRLSGSSTTSQPTRGSRTSSSIPRAQNRRRRIGLLSSRMRFAPCSRSQTDFMPSRCSTPPAIVLIALFPVSKGRMQASKPTRSSR